MKKIYTLICVSIALLSIYGCQGTKQEEDIPQIPEHKITTKALSEHTFLSKRAKSRARNQGIFLSAPIKPYVYNRSRDNYTDTPSNGVQLVAQNPLSTFSIDVDTGSYANVRSHLNMGELPPSSAVREEAFINYFPYSYKTPLNKSIPFSINTEVAPAPWDKKRDIIKIGLKGYDLAPSQRKPSNLVFLIDVSGSMNTENKLPLLKRSLTMLTKQLTKDDSISIVTYANGTNLVLPPTSGNNHSKILHALQQLSAQGGTSGGEGLQLAYQQAEMHLDRDHINRIILATDGDFNIGIRNIKELKHFIRQKLSSGISLTTLGFGRGNYNDALMEQLADVGNGNHAYIDSIHEAHKVLVRQMSGTLQTIASDVKIQVEFNPHLVKEYRLIGYQNRKLKDEDFKNDHVDAGEIGAGHTVTALYEITLVGESGQIDDLRYANTKDTDTPHTDEIAQVKVRYKQPDATKSKQITHYIYSSNLLDSFDSASQDFQFATAVAAFAQKLKHNQYLDNLSYQDIKEIAEKNVGDDPYNYRREFVSLVDITSKL